VDVDHLNQLPRLIDWDFAFVILEIELRHLTRLCKNVVRTLAPLRSKAQRFRDLARIGEPNILGIVPDGPYEFIWLGQGVLLYMISPPEGAS
jgi:hypothetical protein